MLDVLQGGTAHQKPNQNQNVGPAKAKKNILEQLLELQTPKPLDSTNQPDNSSIPKKSSTRPITSHGLWPPSIDPRWRPYTGPWPICSASPCAFVLPRFAPPGHPPLRPQRLHHCGESHPWQWLRRGRPGQPPGSPGAALGGRERRKQPPWSEDLLRIWVSRHQTGRKSGEDVVCGFSWSAWSRQELKWAKTLRHEVRWTVAMIEMRQVQSFLN